MSKTGQVPTNIQPPATHGLAARRVKNRSILIEPLALALACGEPSSIDPNEKSPDSCLYAGSGIVRVVDKPQHSSVGEEVIFIVDSRMLDSNQDEIDFIAIDETMAFKKPAALSSTQAASLSALFLLAVSSACAALGVSCDVLFEKSVESRDHRALLLVGGATPLGSAILQVIHAARPNLFAMTTIGSPEPTVDQQRLSAISIEQIMLGAKYAIDHSADDLADHLRDTLEAESRSRVDCVVDALGGLGTRGRDLQDLVSRSPAPALDVSNVRLSSARVHSLLRLTESESLRRNIGPLVTALEELLTQNRYVLPSYVQIEERRFIGFSHTVQCCSGPEDSVVVFSA